VDTPSTGAGSEHGRSFRDRPVFRVAALAFVLLLAFLVSRTCGSRDTEISQEEAIEIAQDQIDYEADRVGVRFLPQGFQSRPSWAVSLSTEDAEGRLTRVTVVVVDGRTGDVLEVRQG
jgi:hypothetical protein